jgi:hypothetical protein
MVRRLAPIAFLALLASCSSMFGNKDEKTPGDPIGTYQLSAAVDDGSTCAELAALMPRPWKFSVQLRHDGATAYWISGSSPVSGTVDAAKGTFTFSTTEAIPVHDADKTKGLGACTMLRTDDFTGTLSSGLPAGDAGASDEPASLTGSLRYGYVVQPGSDCHDLVNGGQTSVDPLAAWGGAQPTQQQAMFTTLPCYVRFDVTGTRAAQ